jgi:two-component system, NtrC family, response regulator AtoC
MSTSILIVDDDASMRSFVSTILVEAGYLTEEAGSGREALAKISATDFDLAIVDLRMPDLSGLEVMGEGKKAKPEIKWIVITAFGSIGNAVEAMRAGASDYLTKPLKDPDELRHVVRRVLRELEKEQTISLLTEELGKRFPPSGMIFLGEKMQRLYRLVQDVAPTSATVLVTGPSGTGKELVARMIHQLSPRKTGPFVAVHCGALPETLLESELFGHERGAFTGAVTTRKGRFELADKGTVFLDEVAEIPSSVQVKLLRVLQEREFERLGGMKTISVDVRLISATNKELKAEVAEGRFREDLYYRINVFPIALPRLVERRDAIIPLAEYLAKELARNLGRNVGGITEAAKSALLEYEWPGNVRELRNVMERAVILADRWVDVEHLSLENHPVPSAKGLLGTRERETIEQVLTEVGGNRKKAAEILGISLRTLQYRIKEYGL